MKSPCKDCDHRTISCHGKCEAYQEFHVWRDKVNYERWVKNQQSNRDAQSFWRKAFRKNQLRKKSYSHAD